MESQTSLSSAELRECILLSRKILDGEVELGEMNDISLERREYEYESRRVAEKKRKKDGKVEDKPQEHAAASSGDDSPQRLQEYFRLMCLEFLPKAAAARSPAQVRPL